MFPGKKEFTPPPWPATLELWGNTEDGEIVNVRLSDIVNAYVESTSFDSPSAVRAYITENEIKIDFSFIVLVDETKYPGLYNAQDDKLYYSPAVELSED